jgi:hypothetical protein
MQGLSICSTISPSSAIRQPLPVRLCGGAAVAIGVRSI